MPTLGQLRQSAKGLGISTADIRSATSADQLQAMIVKHMNGGSTKTTTRKASTKTTTARRGRPPKATATKTTAVKSKPAAKSTQGKAKRSTADTNGDSGRHMLEDVDYTATDGWNAREGSAPDLIVKALRKFRGNREKVFDSLLPKITPLFVGPRMKDGTKRTKASAETMLRYRISRTAWDFAMKTGQHEKSTNRAEYGTQGTYKKPGASRTAAKRTTAPKTTTAKRTTQKAAQKPAARRAAPKATATKAKTTTAPRKKTAVAKKKTTARR